MGGELGFHGAVRLRGGGDMLGDMGLQDVVRGGAAAVRGESGAGTGAEISHQTGGAAENSSLLQQRRAGDGGGDAVVPDGDDGVVPVRVRGNHGYTFRGFGAGEDELQGMDDVCATLVDFLLHCWSIQFVGRRVFVHWGVMDYSGGYVIHLSSGIAGFTTAFWVGPRLKRDRERFPPNNVLLMLAGAGLLWMGWAGFNGGDPYAANIDSSMAVLNTNICAATSLLVWTWLDVIFFNKPSVIGAVQGMITGLVCITPGAGLVQGWAAIAMGVMSGSVPWFSMMILDKRWKLFSSIDDTLGVFHTHAVAGLLGGMLTGLFAEPELCALFLPVTNSRGGVYGGSGGVQLGKQLVGGLFIIGWNLVVTSIICIAIGLLIPLRMPEKELLIGDDAVHGEEAYALWGDGEKYDFTKHEGYSEDTSNLHPNPSIGATQVV
ncbi:hypothetical protein FEM48_Zijuj08G0202100 [Ziziphus jujuba var. spinosa]|uniref:Ammonium transporter AmtB-like domain-containing protein n=1 Tax=Ziziphus jujuba var. spinosa TaxID=714518 RepID=A0A978V154_ZIZJJ|nr:hypothetical protein FEM48_Zijuj08G0202100 [Ziziphus jujuba var. spinosa]